MAMDIEAARKIPPKVVTIRIRRYDPETRRTWWQEYKVEARRGMTVLDALLQIKEEQDHTLVLRYSCRQGICGSCGMVINGTPRLACQTQVAEVATEANPVITVEPLYNHPVIRDLVTDFTDFFNKHRSVKPYIIRKNMEEVENPKGQYDMYPDEYLLIDQYGNCIYCGLCYAACPVVAADPQFLGPQALMFAARFVNDVRDEAWPERFLMVDTEHGCHRCHFAASCSAVCPKAVDPAGAIQMLRSKLFRFRLGLFKKRVSKEIGPPPERGERIPLPPEAETLPGVDLRKIEQEPVKIELPPE